MSKRKPIQLIKSEVAKLIADAKAGNIKGNTVQYGCGDSLSVAVNKGTGCATWIARVAGKCTVLGDYSKMDYKTASSKVAQLKSENVDSVKRGPKTPTVAEYFEIYLEHWLQIHKQGSNRRNNLVSLMRTTLYPLHKIKLGDLTRKVVIDKIRAIDQTANNKHNAVALLNQMLQYAYNNAVIDSNPVYGLLDGRDSPFPLSSVTHHPSVHYSEFIDKVVEPLSGAPGLYRAMYLMCFLTGFRFGEIRLMRWSWINVKEGAIMIPANAKGSNKSKHTLVKPLTTPMMQLLQYLYIFNSIHSDYVFQSPYKQTPATISNNTVRGPWRQNVTSEVSHFHGVRTTIRSWIKEQKEVDPQRGYLRPIYSFEAAEGALTHDTRDTLEKSYDNSDRIEPVREVLRAWNDWLIERLPAKFTELLDEGQRYPLDWDQGSFLARMHN